VCIISFRRKKVHGFFKKSTWVGEKIPFPRGNPAHMHKTIPLAQQNLGIIPYP
jgi:hypothetical protein